MRGVLAGLGRRTGWDEGDVWTVGLGLALATSLAVSTIPAVLQHRDAVAVGGRPAAAPVTTPTPGAVVAPELTPPAPVLPPPLAPLPVRQPVPATVPAEPAPEAAPAPTRVPVLLRGLIALFAPLPVEGDPGGVAVASDGSVLAATDGAGASSAPASLLRWSPAGALRLAERVPGQPADRSRGLTGLDHLPDGSVVATDAATGRVLRYDDGRWSVHATIPDLPICLGPLVVPCQPGVADSSPLLRGIAVDAAGDVLVTDAGQGTIWRLRGRPVVAEVWHQSDDALGPEGFAGSAVAADGSLLVTVTRFSGLQPSGAGALVRIARNPDGTAGSRTSLAAFAAGEDAVDVAVGATQTYVALRGADAVVVLDRDGTESLRFTGEGLRRPTALALGTGRLLLTTSGPRGAVLQLGIEEGPVA